jgi:hypothetical protein
MICTLQYFGDSLDLDIIREENVLPILSFLDHNMERERERERERREGRERENERKRGGRDRERREKERT